MKMEKEPPEEERFLQNILDLTDLVYELSAMCWDAGCNDINPKLVLLARGYLSGYDPVDLIETYIRYSNEYWGEIKSREENFFINHANEIFMHLPIKTDNINAFKIFFTTVDKNSEYVIIQDDRDAIWDIFESLVKICIKYVHRVRGVKLVDTGKGLRPGYINKKFPEIEVRKLAKIWGIKLPVPGKN